MLTDIYKRDEFTRRSYLIQLIYCTHALFLIHDASRAYFDYLRNNYQFSNKMENYIILQRETTETSIVSR